MYLGIDLGTGSVKLLLVDRNGKETVCSESYPIEAPEAGFSVTDPENWLSAIRKAVKSLPDLSKLRGIGFSGQMHGFVPLDQKGEASLGPAVLWSDQRGASTVSAFASLLPDQKARLCNSPAAGMAATTLLWLKRERPSVHEKITTILFPKDFIRYTITGTLETDFSDASGSVLYDFSERGWYSDVIHALGLKERYLPPIKESTRQAGTVSAAGARLLGLPEGVPVTVGGADAPVGMFGSGLTDRDSVQLSVGTGAQISRPIAPDRLPEWKASLNTFEGVLPEQRYRVAAMLNAGIALEWVRRRLQFDWDSVYNELEQNKPVKKPDLYFLPYLSGERTPYMNPEIRGSWLGLALHHTNSDLILSALLGLACSIRLGLETLGENGVRRIIATGGSLQYPYWRKLLSSVLRKDIEISSQKDMSARGAAAIAAMMLGEPVRQREEQNLLCGMENLPWIDDYYAEFNDCYRKISS